jgi:hypothetical protein
LALNNNAHLGVRSPLNFRLQIIIPRCCEEGIEFSWLSELLSKSTERVRATIMYKCPSCLPRSLAQEWLTNVLTKPSLNGRSTEREMHPSYQNRVRKGIYLIDDYEFASLPDQVTQDHSFDIYYNGKEVSAYLTYIIKNYHHLPDQMIFIHSVPNAHIYNNLFFSSIRWAEQCGTEVKFLHLNVKYKNGGEWGNCCGGKKSACRNSVWKWQFQRSHADYNQVALMMRKASYLQILNKTYSPYEYNGSYWKLGPKFFDEDSAIQSSSDRSTNRFLRDKSPRKVIRKGIKRVNAKGSQSRPLLQINQQIEDVDDKKKKVNPLDYYVDPRRYDYTLQPPGPEGVGTYSSAQFSVSRSSILRYPINFWERMLMAINGTIDLHGCSTNSEPGKEFGGHHLTGQYERIWHMIFGHRAMQTKRPNDYTIPKYFRHDCTSQCAGAV